MHVRLESRKVFIIEERVSFIYNRKLTSSVLHTHAQTFLSTIYL